MGVLEDAIASGDAARVRELARRDPGLSERRGADGLRPAMHALYGGHAALAAELLPAEDRLDLFEAAAFGRAGRARELLAAGADVDARSADGFTALHLACFGDHAAVVEALLTAGADVDRLAESSFAAVRPLGTAAFSGALACARLLLAAGADPDGVGPGEGTPLMSAASRGDAAFVRLLLEAGADPARRAPDGRVAAELAREGGHAAVAQLLG